MEEETKQQQTRSVNVELGCLPWFFLFMSVYWICDTIKEVWG